jgi:hypothetical protein
MISSEPLDFATGAAAERDASPVGAWNVVISETGILVLAETDISLTI